MKKLLIILIFIFATPVFAEDTFVDVESGDWFYDYVQILVDEDVTSGYEDMTYRPYKTISVEEFVTLTLKAMGEDQAEVETTHWSDGYIAKAISLNIIAEVEYNSYTRPVTRGEMGRIVLRATGVEVPDNFMDYAHAINDLDTMTPYWQNIAIRIYSTGIISGYPDGSFGLNNEANRAEAAVILSKVIKPDLRDQPDNEWSLYQKRVSEIKAEWANRMPIQSDVFLEIPSLQVPYEAGALNQNYLTDGLNMMKFVRYIGGVSPDVYLSDTANEYAQNGALLIATSEFSHTPSKPEGMTEDMYQKGYNGTSTGNLAAGVEGIADAIKRLMDDEDPSNIAALGHRRWQLLPGLKEFGIGYVEKDDLYRYYTVVKVFKGMEIESRDFDMVLWPNKEAFPIEFFGNEIPWSVSLNPGIYDASEISDITVSIIDETGNTRVLNSNNKDLQGDYFNVSTAGYGVPFCIVFRPDDYEYELDKKYTIQIDNIYLLDGTKTSIMYETRFFDLY
ncbi:hypothetical protein EZV73_19465 [Acidaminobacter sp. JC074]|uniref:CAP and S-layer homology domain-containing protein n=1 Tax=Acidaminobacter sp. JC074 TaxID=2530199 RepID=UPI001F0E5D0D|nr:S-layer homology domain-containing protein [Acidaminobacter sp. JC074]MCH4889771.1 hypothetical protein [Acidaminobacter sp. JC074]